MSEHLCGLCEIGSYEGMIELVAPSWSSKKTICVDICLAMEITNLWKVGIITTGCCCGHGKALGYIGVWEEDIERMLDLGYEVRPNETDTSRRDGFYPKTKFNTRAVPDVPELVAVSHEVFYAPTREWRKTVEPEYYRKNGDLVRDLIDKSKAAEIIAAKDKEIERILDALSSCQKALNSLVSDESIKNTSVINAYAMCVDAELKARKALKGESNA